MAQTYSTALAAAQGYPDQPAKATIAIEKPRIVQQLDQLAKALSACHDLATNVERAADRILGPVQQDESKTVPTPPANSIDQRFAEAIAYAELLCDRLMHASQRLNMAV